MRTARLLAAIFAPLVVVACAVGNAPESGGGGVEGDGDAGSTSADDSGYGTTGDGSPVVQGDSGSKTDSGSTTHDGGTTPIDSGSSGGTSGLDCVGKTSTSGTSYESECKALSFESDCSIGGGECGAGTCCWDNSGSFSIPSCDGFFGDFLSAQCVAQ